MRRPLICSLCCSLIEKELEAWRSWFNCDFPILWSSSISRFTMKCDDCKKDIEGTYYEVDGKTVCGKDYDEVTTTILGSNFQFLYYNVPLNNGHLSITATCQQRPPFRVPVSLCVLKWTSEQLLLISINHHLGV